MSGDSPALETFGYAFFATRADDREGAVEPATLDGGLEVPHVQDPLVSPRCEEAYARPVLAWIMIVTRYKDAANLTRPATPPYSVTGSKTPALYTCPGISLPSCPDIHPAISMSASTSIPVS